SLAHRPAGVQCPRCAQGRPRARASPCMDPTNDARTTKRREHIRPTYMQKSCTELKKCSLCLRNPTAPAAPPCETATIGGKFADKRAGQPLTCTRLPDTRQLPPSSARARTAKQLRGRP